MSGVVKMLVAVVQIRIVRMVMRDFLMGVKMRMPLIVRNRFPFVRMVMMPVIMLVVVNVFHDHVRMPVLMRK
jgi:hypothetical protein